MVPENVREYEWCLKPIKYIYLYKYQGSRSQNRMHPPKYFEKYTPVFLCGVITT